MVVRIEASSSTKLSSLSVLWNTLLILLLLCSVQQQQQQSGLSSVASAFVFRTSSSSSSSTTTTRNPKAFVASSALTKTKLLLSTKTSAPPLFVDGTKKTTTTTTTTNKDVQEYYGKTLQSSDDLKTNACTTGVSMPKHIQQMISNIHPDVLSKYYGCGLCIPDYDLTGASVLDLGCGSGRDVYLVSQLVGETGTVVGVDMTPEQLNVATQYIPYHTELFQYKQSNVQFVQGYLEQLGTIDELKENTFDLIISNCVINLCTDKRAVLEACYKLLRPGGELYFSDVYSNRRIPIELQNDKVLWGECLSGALYWNDFHNLAKTCGFIDPRLVDDKPITINNKNVQTMIDSTGNGNIEFYSATYRLQKLDETVLEPACEDYGQAVIYKGTIQSNPQTTALTTTWTLDKHHVFEYGRIHPVCGNTWNMLQGNPRIKDHFEYIGNFNKHYGIFEGCGSSLPYTRGSSSSSSGGSASSSSSGGCC